MKGVNLTVAYHKHFLSLTTSSPIVVSMGSCKVFSSDFISAFVTLSPLNFLMMHDDKWCITLFLPCTSFFITKQTYLVVHRRVKRDFVPSKFDWLCNIFFQNYREKVQAATVFFCLLDC